LCFSDCLNEWMHHICWKPQFCTFLMKLHPFSFSMVTCIVYNTSQAIRFTGYFLINTRLSADINAVFQNWVWVSCTFSCHGNVKHSNRVSQLTQLTMQKCCQHRQHASFWNSASSKTIRQEMRRKHGKSKWTEMLLLSLCVFVIDRFWHIHIVQAECPAFTLFPLTKGLVHPSQNRTETWGGLGV